MSTQRSKRHGRRRAKQENVKRVKTAYRYDPPKPVPRMVRR